MLNPFPDLLLFGFFAPTLLRAAAALAFAYIAYTQWRRRNEIARLQFPIIGRGPYAWFGVAFHTLVAAGLFFGYHTQLAVLAGIVGLCLGLWLNRRHPSAVILSNSTIFLLMVTCLSLLLSGAGALAFDLPL